MSTLCGTELENNGFYYVEGSKNGKKFHYYLAFTRLIQTTNMNMIQGDYYDIIMNLVHKDYKMPASCFTLVKLKYNLSSLL